jgi:hypothetical protein
MALKDLISVDRAKLNISAITDATHDGQLQALITSVSDAIEKYCRRRFVTRSYDELYNGDGGRRMLLRQYPIQSVQSVRYRPVTVLKVGNALASNVQARVSVTNLGLLLYWWNGTDNTDSSLVWSSYPTLGQLATALNSVGNGWNGQVVGDSDNYANWPSRDLYWPNSYGDPLEGVGILQSQGALSTVVGSGNAIFAELKMHTYELQGYQWDPRGWLLRAIPYTDPELLHPEDLVFPVGINNFRIQYTAGYSTIPEAVQEACAEWVSELYFLTTRDPALMHQVPSGGTASGWAPPASSLGLPPVNVMALLAPYRRHTIGTNQG